MVGSRKNRIQKHKVYCCTPNNATKVNAGTLGKALENVFVFQHFLLHLKSQRMKAEKKEGGEEEEKPHLTVLLQQSQFTRSWPISIQGWLMWADVRFAPSSPQHSCVCLRFH